MNILIKPMDFLSCAGGKKKLQILIYHRVLASKDPLQPSVPSAGEFKAQMLLVSKYFKVLTLMDAVHLMYHGSLPNRAMCITFDDGYADNLTVALPVLRDLGLPFAVFVATGYLNGGTMFNDIVLEAIRTTRSPEIDLSIIGLSGEYKAESTDEKISAYKNITGILKYLTPDERQEKALGLSKMLGGKIPGDLMLTTEQLIRLSESGVYIGGHTVNHPILSCIDSASAFNEIRDGRMKLENILQKPVEVFAYPNGLPDQDFNEKHVAMVAEAGFKSAVSTAKGYSTEDSNRFKLMRFTPWDTNPQRFILRLVSNYINR